MSEASVAGILKSLGIRFIEKIDNLDTLHKWRSKRLRLRKANPRKTMAAYHLNLTAPEVDSLCRLVGRYHYAETLWKIMGGVNDDGTMDADLAEHQVWEFQRAVEEEHGFLPCCGGPLTAKIVGLLGAIV